MDRGRHGMVAPLIHGRKPTGTARAPRGAWPLLAALVTAQLGAASDAPIQAAQDETTITLRDSGLLDVHARSVPIGAVLEMLSYQARTNIVTSTSVTGSVSANLYGVTLETALNAILLPNKLGYMRMGDVIFVGTPEEIAQQQPPPETRVFELRYLTRREAYRVVKDLMSAEGKVGDSKTLDSDAPPPPAPNEFDTASVEYLVVTDYSERLEMIARLLSRIDTRPQQVLIEATILRATLNEDNQLGIDISLLHGVDFENVSSVSAPAAQNLLTGPLRPGDFQNTSLNLSTDLIGSFPGGGFTFGIIKNNVATFIRALEDVTDVSVLANPKVVTLNRQQAEIIVGRRDGYLTTTVTETAAIQTVEFLETGTQVRLRPVVNRDGTVRLEIKPKDSNGGLTADNLPFEETTEATTQLLVENGHTVLIGGLFRERTVSSRSQVPLLGQVPVAGALFQKTADQTVREEVIILLTVKVLSGSQAENGAFDELLEDVERVRVGTRKGLLGVGRERLAQAYYQEALSQYEAGDYEGALLNVRMSLHNRPQHISALKLKERLLGERLWESDGSRSRSLLFELLDAEKGAGQKPRLGQPAEHRRLLHGDAPDAERTAPQEEEP